MLGTNYNPSIPMGTQNVKREGHNFFMGDSPSEKRDTVQIHLRISADISQKFREVAALAMRDLSAQFKVIFLEWLESQQGKATTGISGRKVRTVVPEEAHVIDPQEPGNKTSSETPGTTGRHGAGSHPHRK